MHHDLPKGGRLVDITIETKQIDYYDSDEEQVIRIVTKGKCYKKNNETKLVYREYDPESNQSGLVSFTIEEEGSIKMNRIGYNDLRLYFVANQEPESTFLNTAQGRLPLKLRTQKILLDDSEVGGNIKLKYKLDFMGQADHLFEFFLNYKYDAVS